MQGRLRRRGQRRFETPTGEDPLVESVLAHVMTERTGVSVIELALRLGAGFDQGSSGSAVERAVRELVRDGRLEMEGGKVVPPRRTGW